MSFTWTPVPPSDPDLTSLQYCIWKFRQKAGLSQQDSTYEAALDDESVEDLLKIQKLTLSGTDYYQPLEVLANYIRADPEQRVESQEGDASDKWTDPYERADALEWEQELLNRSLIPGYVATLMHPGPILTQWTETT